MKNKTLHIVDKDSYDKEYNEQEDMAWQEVQRYYLQTKTLDEINSKPLGRAGKQMRMTVYQLLYAVQRYDLIRGKK